MAKKNLSLAERTAKIQDDLIADQEAKRVNQRAELQDRLARDRDAAGEGPPLSRPY